MKKYRQKLLLFLLSFSLIFSFSCKGKGKNILEYQEKKIDAVVTFSIKNSEYRAKVSLSESEKNSGFENRNFCIEFLSPYTLEKVVIEGFAGGNIKVKYENIEKEFPFYENSFLSFAKTIPKMFCIEEPVEKVELCQFENQKCNLISTKSYKIYTKSNLPLKIRNEEEDFEIYIESFT